MAAKKSRKTPTRRHAVAPPPPAPLEGEVAFMDPRRLFTGAPGSYRQWNPSVLVGKRGLNIFERMRADDQVKAALAFKKHTILASGWTVTSPEGQSKDWEPTRFVKHCLAWLDHGAVDGTFENDMLEILSALDFGYSLTEKVFYEIDRGEFEGKIGLRHLKTRRPHEFTFDQDQFGNLHPDGIIQEGNTLFPGGRLPAWKFVVFVHEPRFGNLFGTSDLEAAFRPYWLKDNAYKWLAMLLERLGIPPVFGLYNPSRYSPAQREDLKTIVQNLQAATFGVLPRPDKEALEFWAPELAGQANRVFIPALDMLNKDISRAILMPGLLGMTPDLATGSYARAQVQFDVFLEVVEHLRRTLRQTVIQNQIVIPLVDLNYPDMEEYPLFEFLPITEEIRLDILKEWTALIQGGIVTPQDDDETHVRRLVKFPELAKDGIRKRPEPVQPQAQEPKPEEPNDEEQDDAEMVQYAVRRKPDRLEAHVNFEQIASRLDSIESGAKTKFVEALESARDALISDAAAILNRGAADTVELLSLQKSALTAVARDLVGQAYLAGEEAIAAEVPPVKQFQFTPAQALAFLESKALHIAGVLADRLLIEAKQVLLNAIRFGETQRETLAKLAGIFEPYVGDTTVLRDGKPITANRLETVLRTNATEAFNTGRVTAAQPIAAALHGMRYSAVLDDRTTEVCQHLDGKIIPMDDPDLDKLSPPNHFNCRSVLVPITLDIQVDEGDFISPSEKGRALELAQEGFV